MHVDHDIARDAFVSTLTGFFAVADSLSDDDLQAASRCRGWTVGDVLAHVHLGLQEMLLGLVSRTDGAPDTDAASYWQIDLPTNDEGADEVASIRFVRLLAAAYRRPTGLVGHMRPTVEGVMTAARQLAPGAVRFQRRVLSTGDFLATWACELAVHHLDLGRELQIAPPAPAGLRVARETIEALAGGALPAAWPDETAVLLGAGRVSLDEERTTAAGDVAARLPVFG